MAVPAGSFTQYIVGPNSLPDHSGFQSAANSALYFGYPEQFREINLLSMSVAAAGGWTCTIEYPSAVAGSGFPTAWGTITTATDTTAGYTSNGQITFDPPADGLAAQINGQAAVDGQIRGTIVTDTYRYFYIRFRTTNTGTVPVYGEMSGRDWSGGGYSTIWQTLPPHSTLGQRFVLPNIAGGADQRRPDAACPLPLLHGRDGAAEQRYVDTTRNQDRPHGRLPVGRQPTADRSSGTASPAVSF